MQAAIEINDICQLRERICLASIDGNGVKNSRFGSCLVLGEKPNG